ncbi:hypothetical protein NKI50_01800 [Mesorhizobium sp. M0563]|uniref:hypothetical protein n=1 Tax=Mesorhizobium sp. M0563 TaxID=2956959 RepID=UPI00333BB0DE
MNETVPGAVVAAVRVTRFSLLDAQFRLDDADYECMLLDSLVGGSAALLAEWAGRRVPQDPDPRRLWNPCDPSSGYVPEWMTEAAIEWRLSKRRSY